MSTKANSANCCIVAEYPHSAQWPRQWPSMHDSLTALREPFFALGAAAWRRGLTPRGWRGIEYELVTVPRPSPGSMWNRRSPVLRGQGFSLDYVSSDQSCL